MIDMTELDNIVDFAIRRGTTSLSYYSDCAVFSDARLSTIFEALYRQELVNQSRLLTVKTLIRSRSSELIIPSRRIREYLVDVEPAEKMNGLQALLWASIRLDTSQKLYYQLGECVEDNELRGIFASLSVEESMRKCKIEADYDDILMD